MSEKKASEQEKLNQTEAQSPLQAPQGRYFHSAPAKGRQEEPPGALWA